jgi:carbon-monoxide dehydrogenase small subunit
MISGGATVVPDLWTVENGTNLNQVSIFALFRWRCLARRIKLMVLTPDGATVSIPVKIRVNGKLRETEVEPRLLLVQFLREVCGLTGTHVGCETGVCGACTVLIDGMAVKSCTMLAVQADGSEITTIEGLAHDGQMHPVQEGFWECHGLQCGYCTPGMIMAAVQLLERNGSPSRDEIRHALDGNLCRCTGYSHIVDAVEHAAKKGRM